MIISANNKKRELVSEYQDEEKNLSQKQEERLKCKDYLNHKKEHNRKFGRKLYKAVLSLVL